MRRIGSICAFLVVTTTLSAGLELGADAAYFNPKLTARSYPSLAATQNSQFAGPLFTGYGHLTVALTPVLTMGVGLSLGFSPQTAQEYPAGATKEEMSVTRFGADGKLQLEVLPMVSPYIRLTLGKDWYFWKDNGTVGNQSYSAESSAGGFFYSALLGVQFPFTSDFALYLQGGYTASLASTLVVRNYAVGGVAQPVSAPNTADTTISGILIGAGGRLSF